MPERLEPICDTLKANLNRFIYCHHCKHLNAMRIKGRAGAQVVYACTTKGCGCEVRLVVARSAASRTRDRQGAVKDWGRGPMNGGVH